MAQPVFAMDAAALSAAFVNIATNPHGGDKSATSTVQILQDFAKGTKTFEDAKGALEVWPIKSYVYPNPTPARDASGNNVVHKLLEHSEIDASDMVKLIHIFTHEIFEQKNNDNLSPFEAYPEKLRFVFQSTDGLYSSNRHLWDLLSELQGQITYVLGKVLSPELAAKINKNNPENLIWALQQKQYEITSERRRAQEEQQRVEEDIETLRGFIRGEKTNSEAMWALEMLAGNAVAKPQILALRDSHENNLAHKFLEHISYAYDGVPQITKLIDFGDIDLFNQVNKDGLTPIAAYPKNFAGLLEPLVDYSTLVGSDYTTLRPYPDAHPERQAQLKLQKLLKPAAQRDVQGVVERFVLIDRNNSDYDDKLSEFFHIVNGFIGTYGSQISIPLERITDPTFYDWLAGYQEGKAYMLNYKVNGKESLYNYFSKHDIDGDVRNISSKLLSFYFEQRTPSASEVDLQRLENAYWIEDLLQKPNGVAILKAYKNNRGENLASIALGSNDRSWFQSLVDAIPGLLTEKSPEGVSPLMMLALAMPQQYYDYDNSKEYDSYYDYLVSKTPSLASERDPYGHTIGQLHGVPQSHDPMAALDFFTNMFKSQALDNTLWERMINHPYSRPLEMDHRFDLAALYTVMNQAQTPVHRSFLQQSLDKRDEANKLWKGLIATAEQRIPEEHRDRMLKIHDAVKVLGLAGFAQQTMMHQALDEAEFLALLAGPKFKTLQTLQSKLLSTGGTFGMNFHRSANFEEAQIMMQNLQSLGRAMTDPSAIINSLIVRYSSVLAKDQQEKLDDHQINCAVIALSSIINFDEIDRLLATKFHGASIKSAERFHKFEEAGLTGRSHHSSRRSNFDGGNFDSDDEH